MGLKSHMLPPETAINECLCSRLQPPENFIYLHRQCWSKSHIMLTFIPLSSSCLMNALRIHVKCFQDEARFKAGRKFKLPRYSVCMQRILLDTCIHEFVFFYLAFSWFLSFVRGTTRAESFAVSHDSISTQFKPLFILFLICCEIVIDQ